MQPVLEIMDLALCKPCGIASHSFVSKPRDTFSAVLSAPFHEGDSAAPGDFHNPLCGVAGAVQSDRLVAGARRAIFAGTIGIGEFPRLFFG